MHHHARDEDNRAKMDGSDSVNCDTDAHGRAGEVDEDCSSGLPSTCDEECANVLVPFRTTVRNEIHHQVDNPAS
jgi:hypothetical protein